jgi:hypothetical protein
LLDRFTQAPSRGVIKVFVVAKFGVVSEIDRRLAHVDRRRQALRPRLQAVKLGLRKHRRFHVCDEFRKCTNVDADGVPPGDESLHKRRAATDMVVEHQVAGLGERLDGGAGEDRREPGRIFIKAVGEPTHRLVVTRPGDQCRLRGARQPEQCGVVRFNHG